MPFPIRKVQAPQEKVIDYQYIRTLKNKEVRKKRFQRTFAQQLFRVLLFVVLIGELGYLSYQGWRILRSSTFFSLHNVEISGTDRMTAEEIKRQVTAGQASALSADLTQIKLTLESNPWIQSAVIWRELPGTIRVHITERKPAAFVLAGSLYLVDNAGRVIHAMEDSGGYAQLPIITGIPDVGNETLIRSALDFVDAVSADESILAQISEFHYYDKYNTIIYLKGYPYGLLVSKKDILPMLKKFMAYSAFIKNNFADQKLIDLRYDGQIVLKGAYREQL